MNQTMPSLLENMPGMTFIKDADTGVYLACNQAFAEYAHKETPEGVVGLTDAEIFDAKTAAHFVEDDRTALAMDKPFIFYEDVADAVGSKRQFQTTKMKYTGTDGRLCLLGMCQDVTDMVRIKRENASTKEAYEQARNTSLLYNHLAHALARGHTDLFYVNMESDELIEFHTDDGSGVLSEARHSADFFEGCARDARLYVHPDDQVKFVRTMTREFLSEALKESQVYEMTYRRIKEGRAFYVKMRITRMEDDPRMIVVAVWDIDELMKQRREQEGPRLVVGLGDVDTVYRQKEIVKEIAEQKDVYDQITASLAEQYDTLYYVDIATSTYHEISSTDAYKKLNVPATGKDFFAESRRSIRKYVHPEDQELAMNLHYKDVMLNNLQNRNSTSVAYRLVVDGQVRHIRHTEIMARDKKHLIICIENIDEEVKAQLALKEDKKRSVTYTQIAERLASHYDFIYYIDCQSSGYDEFSTRKRAGELQIESQGDDFFGTARKNAERLIYFEDRERIQLFLNKDHLISQLESRRQLTEDYRMNVGGGKTQFTRMSVTYSSDHSHFIICVENRDKDVRKEQEQLAALSMANELARRDELTRTKNKTAYQEAEKELQEQLEKEELSFGIVICDINGLKIINDTEGHKAGDEYIKASCKLICRVFAHSPVFRIGGDEFVVILKGQDFDYRDRLLSKLRRQVEEHVRIGEGPVVASGLSVYRPGEDRLVEEVFNRADTLMYENKAHLKEQKLLRESHSMKAKANVRMITEERRIMLDSLYKSLEVIAEGTYVYLCDMKYDFSRWSKNAVDTFGLPSEYMYGAGDIWENVIHPEDRAAYHKGIDEIFSGNTAGHDMQYRAKRVSGGYDVCTCRGVVIRDHQGEPDYFMGTIRNHGIQGHMDSLTGLRNQYGFFEDLDSYLKRNTEISVALFGISKFSELNEMYGYHFGNRVLQTYARRVYEAIGNTGHTYRIDGTKFAVISNTLTVTEMREKYEQFRAYLHESFLVDNRKILLDLHCGTLRVKNFDIDSQTVYACLNYADEESKLRRQGEMVEFQNAPSDENHERLEMYHAIRASIMRGFEGFYLLYQPVVDAKIERLIGAEALLRWKNDRYGMVPPDRFIPILETDPLFPDLGEWILREAILAAKEIRQRVPEFVMNVNLSYAQLEKPDFVDTVFRILEDYGYPAKNLCLEVTERCRLLDMDLLKNVVSRLKAGGILVALDDFGTGFSAVGLIREIPFDTIKVDRSFVLTIEEKDSDRQLIRNIVDLASIYGARVCVEGVETANMRDILTSFNVKSFQGYFYSRPIALDGFLEWEKARNSNG